MLVTIFNLPAQTRYVDVKSLIHTKCGFKEVILDNLTSDSNNTKKVTVGLAEEEDAAILVRKINGLFVEGQQLYVETVKKKAPSAVINMGDNQKQQQPMLQQPYYQQNRFQPNYELSFAQMQQSRAQPLAAAPIGYGGLYGNMAQNASANYGYPQQMQYQATPQQLMGQSMVGYDQAPLGFSNHGNKSSVWSDQNDWNLASNASAGNQISQQGRTGSRWQNTDNSSGHPRRDEPDRDSGRDRPSRFGNDAPLREGGRDGPRREFGRDGPSRDRGRDAPRAQGRDRDQGRDREPGRDRFQGRDREQGRDRGTDAPARDRGREPPARSSAPFREPPARNAPQRDHGQPLYNRRPTHQDSSRAPTKRPITKPPSVYGQHVTNPSSSQMRTFSQQRDGSKPNQPWTKPQQKQKKAESNYTPPQKRSKGIAALANKGQEQAKKTASDGNLDHMPIKAATWRHQIASLISKEILNIPKYIVDVPREPLIAGLKRGIRCRLEELFGNDYEISMPEMLRIYREKFDSNKEMAFFNQVKEEVKTLPNLDDFNPKAPVVNKVTSNKAPAKVVIAPPAQTAGKPAPIPCYPQGDKRANKVEKKVNAVLFQNESVLLSKMDPPMQKAVIAEMDELGQAIASEFEAEVSEKYKEFNEKHKAPSLVDDCKKMITVNLGKRLLNIGPIMLRIYTAPKTLSRTRLAPALIPYGVTSLRKAEKKKPPVYYGTCETYDDHDRLCQMDSLVVDDCTVVIKPFHLTGKSEKRAMKINYDRNWLAVVSQNNDTLEEMDDEIDENDVTNYGQGEEDNDEGGDDENQETEVADDEDTNGNIKLQTNEEENGDENAAESEINPEKNADEYDNNEQAQKAPEDDIDFTEDPDFNKETTSFKINKDPNFNTEKADSKVDTQVLKDTKANIIDEIDMDDLNDDDLEDW